MRLRHFFLLLILLATCQCGVAVRKTVGSLQSFKNSSIFHQGRHGPLNKEEQLWASIAWKYFQKNYQDQTGLVNSVEGQNSITMWQVADYLAAILAAHDLEMIDFHEMDRRLSKVLAFLNTMTLYNGKLPNHAYHTQTRRSLNFANKPGKSGWSAVDLGRLLRWLYIAKVEHPHFSEYIDRAVLRWNFCELIDDCGTLYGAVHHNGKPQIFQEGRLGLEEYAAKGFALWGFNTQKAATLEPFQTVYVYGEPLKIDRRDPRETGVQAPLLSTGFLLDGLELNWDHAGDHRSGSKHHSDTAYADLAQTIYDLQARRYQVDRIFTARADHQLSRKPYFIYDSIFSLGFAWNTTDEQGTFLRHGALVSTKAAFGMWALWKTHYTDELLKVVACLGDPKRGWLEGRHEKSGAWENLVTLSTNAAILEALWYKKRGKILTRHLEGSYFGVNHEKLFRSASRCLPKDRERCQ